MRPPRRPSRPRSKGSRGVDPGTLEWLLRETLGLGAHRLDAWATSLARERLDRLRTARPQGIQVGAFGWVTGLEPTTETRTSAGFIHAPSMAHATTAALLRAGWEAHGSNDAASPAAIDLRSDRVRTASWLLEGVRQGQPLGNLLGYRFERNLHDRSADADITIVRAAVLAADDRANARPDTPVDGIALLDLWRGEGLHQPSDAVVQALEDLEAAFDAVGDVGLFEAVHQLAAGNGARATAMLDALSTGTIAPPELRAPRTPRSATSVSHRVLVLLDPAAPAPGAGWEKGVRDSVAPALEAWVASLLPAPSAVHFSATGTAGPAALTLQSLKLAALDAIYAVGSDPTIASPALCTLAAGAMSSATAVTVDPADAPAGAVSLADFGVLALEIRRILEGLRPADARDLRPAAQAGDPDVDLGPSLDAADGLLRLLDSHSDGLDDGIDDPNLALQVAEVGYWARIGVSNGGAPADVAAATALQELVAARLATCTAISVDSTDRAPGLEARLGALFGRRLPLLGRFTIAGMPADPDTGAAAGPVVDLGGPPADATPEAVDEWIDAVGRVRADVGSLATAGVLSQLLGGGGLTLSAGQQPLVDGEPWAATGRPAGAGRLSVVAASTLAGPRRPGQAACGFVVDRWSEPVPSPDQVTGLAFQFDAPGARAPQAWLVAVTPDDEPWSLTLVTETLLETLDWAALRGVGPEDLVDYGRSIPATFVPGEIAAWPVEA